MPLTSEAERAIAGPWTARRGPVRVFRAPILDGFTRTPPWSPFVVYLPVVGALLDRAGGGWVSTGLAVAAGWLVWSATEYAMHRFLFHLRPRGDASRVVLFLVHGHHHAFPEDRTRLVATLPQSASVFALLGWSFRAWSHGHSWALLAGAMVGYLAYEAVHWTAHHGAPERRLGRWLRNHHLRHHHEAPTARFGIGSPLWDWVLGTARTARDGGS